MDIGMNFKSLFLDRKAVMSAVDRATLKVHRWFGGYVRRVARNSIKRRRGVSEAGSPPHSHEGSLKRLIFFGLDRGRRSVVVGPVKFRRGVAPALLEYGGTTTIKATTVKRDPSTSRLVRSQTGGTTRATYRARPFMTPAFEASKPKLPSFWADAIRKTAT